MVGTRRLTALATSTAARLRLPEGPLVVGLSGGADSATLAYLCQVLERDVTGLHVNHQLPHSPLMERAARDVAAVLGIDLDVVAVAVDGGPSPEGQARRARYEAFSRSLPADQHLLTAHTVDDNVETIIFNLVRGTGPRGLAGIPYHRPDAIFRPMLSVSRGETREIAALARLPYVDDPMNDDPTLARNFIRTRVIPLLSELNPRITDSVARMGAVISADNSYLDELATTLNVVAESGSAAVAIGSLRAAHRAVGARVIAGLIQAALGDSALTADRVAKVWAVVEGQATTHELGDGVSVSRDGPMLVISSPGGHVVQGEVALTPGVHRQGSVQFEVIAADGVCKVLPLSRWSAVFPSDANLRVRADGAVLAGGRLAWQPGVKRYPVAWYEPGSFGYLSVSARENRGWTSSH